MPLSPRSKMPMPKPQSNAELEIASAAYFGTPLHLEKLDIYRNGGSYEVAEDFDSYDPTKGDYDFHRRFWDWACGSLHCGGTARASYGQFRCGHRQRRRLERWVRGRREGDSSSVRLAFAKVSRTLDGSGENTPNRADRGVL